MEKMLCLRCGHEWFKRQEKDPVCCARCHSPLWNKERVRKVARKEFIEKCKEVHSDNYTYGQAEKEDK